jgi:hypothetical protein
MLLRMLVAETQGPHATRARSSTAFGMTLFN